MSKEYKFNWKLAKQFLKDRILITSNDWDENTFIFNVEGRFTTDKGMLKDSFIPVAVRKHIVSMNIKAISYEPYYCKFENNNITVGWKPTEEEINKTNWKIYYGEYYDKSLRVLRTEKRS